MGTKLDVERLRAVFASPEITHLLDSEDEAYLAAAFTLLDYSTEKQKKRKPKPPRIKRGKRK